MRVPVGDLITGMVVERSIIDANQRVLLSSGQALTDKYIQKIIEYGVGSVFITDGLGLEEPDPPVNEATVRKVTNALKNCYQNYLENGSLHTTELNTQVDNIIDELLINNKAMVGMAEIKSYDEYTYQHSISVCILAIMLGVSNGYNRDELHKLGIGALLHDIGKITIPINILNKPGALNSQERSLLLNHPWEGFNIIRSSEQISLISANVAMQHHERIDGTGYPSKLRGDSIHEFAQITTVVDIYDALVSDRPYRPGFTNQEALDIIKQAEGTAVSAHFAELLGSRVNIYPVGTVVALTTGATAVVVKENVVDPQRPQVKLLFDRHGKVHTTDTIELADNRLISIRKSYSSKDGADIIFSHQTNRLPQTAKGQIGQFQR